MTGRVAEACRRAGRGELEVSLVGACKRQPLERILEAVDAGLRILGENQVQEGEAHRAALREAGHDDVEWRLIGPLQTNKAPRACRVFDVFEAVDRVKVARRLDRVLRDRQGGVRTCLLEVNIGREPSKHGFLPEDTGTMLGLAQLDHLLIRGLMAIPPRRSDPGNARRDFAALRRLRDELGRDGLFGEREGWLSMGMSADFEAAVLEGATHVRIGSALFGPRPPR
ncbi:MAG: YggS family pyridoxal phosphate-dependent enzyme [Acidobacteria bacterium]|nr:YggS family pyridoxal phosphate-dependent enzyme [Acidobacteriota bacterium]MCY3966613.1 YggS family pyridoxal phosphate-dependent enzyme [Acidobacteriota bacterium]